MRELIIIIPTHKRHRYLDSKIKYYADCGFEIHICDSTPEEFEYNRRLPLNIFYHWMPTSGFYDKVLTILEQIDSKMVILTPDDDFLDMVTLNECKETMLLNCDISLSVGLQVCFNEPYDGEWYIIPGANRLRNQNLMQDKISNAKVFGRHYQNVLWSLYRKDVILEVFTKLKRHNYKNANFIELTLACEATIRGCIYVSPGYLNYREMLQQSSHWGAEVPELSLKNIKKYPDIQKEMDIHINQYVGEERIIVKEWISSYLNASKRSFIKRTVGKILRKFLKRIHFSRITVNTNTDIDKLLKDKAN